MILGGTLEALAVAGHIPGDGVIAEAAVAAVVVVEVTAAVGAGGLSTSFRFRATSICISITL